MKTTTLMKRGWPSSAARTVCVVLHVVVRAAAFSTIARSAFGQQTGAAPPPDSARRAAAGAADPRAVQPQRPTVATHAFTIAPGYIEIETGAQEARPRGRTEFAAPVVVKVGILRRLQLELQGGYARSVALNTTTEGATDLAVALKQRVLDSAPVLGHVSVQGSIKFPTGARGVGSRTTDLSLLLIVSRTLGAAELDLNGGYTHRSGNGAAVPTSATFLTASFGTPISGELGGVAELFCYPGTAGPSGAPPAVGFLVGPTLRVRPWLVLDAGAILNVQHLSANAVYAGLTYNVGRIPGFRSLHRVPRGITNHP